MGKSLLFLVGAFVVAGGSLLYGTVNQSSLHKTELAGDYAARLMARELAHTGIQDALQQLSNAYESAGSYSGPLTWTGSYEGGTFSNTLTISGTDHTIISRGTIDGEEYVVSREYNFTSGSAIPPSMTYALTSENSIEFNADANIDSPIFNGVQKNADIFSNDDIIFNSGFVCVFGFGNRADTLEINTAQTEAGIFLPHSNPDSKALTPVVSEIEIPEIDASAFQSGATLAELSGLDINGSYTLGSEETPSIWYIDGNLTTSGVVTFNGYGIIVVTGDVYLNHDVFASSSFEEGAVAIYSESKIKAQSSGIDIEAHLYANDYIYFADQIDLTGTVTTRQHLELGHLLYVYYRPPSSAIVTPVASGIIPGFELVNNREWAVN